MTLSSRAGIATAIAVACASAIGHADPDRIVIESYEGQRASDAATVLAPAYAELQRRGYVSGAPLVAAIDHAISRAGGALDAGQVVEAQKQVDDAYQKFIDGDYKRALTEARAALALYDLAQGQLAREPTLREPRSKALIIAARSSEVAGKSEDAFGLMAEEIRSFPDRVITNAQFDPAVSALYRRVKDELAHQGTGSLEVKVDDPAVTIFIDEQYAAAGAARRDKLAPGRYRVYVAKGQTPGRVHEVDVAPGAAASLTVPWAVDGTLATDGGVVALRFEPGTGADAEVATVTRIARTLGAGSAVILSVRQLNGRRGIVGYSINIASQTRTFAGVQIEPVPPSPDKVSALAALLAGDKNAASTGLITREEEPIDRGSGPGGRHGLGGRRVAALALGGVALASLAGAVAFELSSSSTYDQSKREPDDARQKSLYDSANQKYEIAQGLAVGGLACAAGAAILWFTGGERAEPAAGVAVAPVPSPDGFSVTLSGRF